jgi:3-phenylpropionate/trans-cinnamate dioxygenase ferredoxin component
MSDWVKVAKAGDIGPAGLYALLGDEEILLVRKGESVYALAYLCSHQDMEMEGGHCEDDGWVCPHHGARFSLETGEALSMPAIEPVKRFDVKVEEGEVYLKEPGA